MTINAQEISIVPIDTLHEHPANPRKGDIETIRQSLRAYGFVNPCLVQRSTMTICAGNHRWQAARLEGYEAVPVILLDLSDDEALGLLLMDNRSADRAEYDVRALYEAWVTLQDAEFDMIATGWQDGEIEALMTALGEAEGDGSFRDGTDPDDDTDDSEEAARGVALALQQATIGEPTHQPRHGQHYRLGNHDLYIGDVVSGHQHWTPLLTDPTDLFVPYPGPYIPLTTKGTERRLVMVQPNVYLAGHLLDKWAAANGDDTIMLVHLHD